MSTPNNPRGNEISRARIKTRRNKKRARVCSGKAS